MAPIMPVAPATYGTTHAPPAFICACLTSNVTGLVPLVAVCRAPATHQLFTPADNTILVALSHITNAVGDAVPAQVNCLPAPAVAGSEGVVILKV